MTKEGSKTRPVYRKMKENENPTSNMCMIVVDEGWRTWILCTGVYEQVADQLIQRLAAYPQEWDY